MTYSPILSKEHALELLEETRADLIARARKVAFALAKRDHEVTVHDVWMEMDRLGLLTDEDKAKPAMWKGSVFKVGETWEFVRYDARSAIEDRNTHSGPIGVWRLKGSGPPLAKRPSRAVVRRALQEAGHLAFHGWNFTPETNEVVSWLRGQFGIEE